MKIDRNAYAGLVRAHHGRVLRLCEVLLSNPVEAEDAAQDIFIKAYAALSTFREDASFLTWITRIAHNHCLDLLRKRARQKTESLESIPDSHQPVDFTDSGAARELLESLTPESRQILALREISGLRYDEIATNLRCSLDAVKARLRRARQELQEKSRHFSGPSNV